MSDAPVLRPATLEVIQGDCRDVLVDFDDESFDCVIADPPYAQTSLEWDRWPDGWPQAVRRVLKKTGSMWVFGSMRMFLDRSHEFFGFRYSQDIVWEKHNGSGFHNDRFRRVHEHATMFYRSDAAWDQVFRDPQFTDDATKRTIRRKKAPAHWYGDRGESTYASEDGGARLMRSVMFARSEHGRALHPTQKPIEVIEPLARYSTPPGGRILDPFAGSGTTGAVAKKIGASAVLIEADENFCAVARSRCGDV